MMENYKGWKISLTWQDKDSFLKVNKENNTYKNTEKWKGVNSNGRSIYGASLKEIRHIIDYPLLYE